MGDTITITSDQYRTIISSQYLGASEALFAGLKAQRGVNDFHFVVSLRSFIEYTRRGIWFLVWATEADLLKAGEATFQRPGSPSLTAMDALINQELGDGKVSHLKQRLPGINEPFIDCLHALTHGNPISARMLVMGLTKIFDTTGLLAWAEINLGIFRILVYRRMLGRDFKAIWEALIPIHNDLEALRVNVLIAAQELKESGKTASSMGATTHAG